MGEGKRRCRSAHCHEGAGGVHKGHFHIQGGSEGGKEAVHLPAGDAYVTEEQSFFFDGTFTYLTLGIVEGGAGKGVGKRWCGPGRGQGLVFEQVGLNGADELCTHSRGTVDPCFVVFAKELRGGRA